MKNRYLKFLITVIIILVVFLLTRGCSRGEPATGVPQITVKKIFPVNTILLDISEPSGIAYNSKSNTLFIVSDSKPEVYEVDLTGKRLRSVNIGGADLEGIAVSQDGDTLYAAEERNRRIKICSISGATLGILTADVATIDNSALEGVAVKKNSKTIYVVNEKDPAMLLCYQNLNEVWRKPLGYTLDLSDICYEDSTGFLWLISDESAAIVKMNADGVKLDQWEIPFFKGEGITVVGNKLYVVNDQDGKLYIFNRP